MLKILSSTLLSEGINSLVYEPNLNKNSRQNFLQYGKYKMDIIMMMDFKVELCLIYERWRIK